MSKIKSVWVCDRHGPQADTTGCPFCSTATIVLEQEQIEETIAPDMSTYHKVKADRDRLRELLVRERQDHVIRIRKLGVKVTTPAKLAEKVYPHMCRDGHDEIGFSGDEERCPMCRMMEDPVISPLQQYLALESKMLELDDEANTCRDGLDHLFYHKLSDEDREFLDARGERTE